MKVSLYRNLLDTPDAPFPWDGAIRSFGWWQAMAQCPQDVIHHAEGDVATHTRLVMEAMQGDPNWQALPQPERGLLLLTALLHDIGKPDTTREEEGRITARGHAGRGEVMVRRLLWEAGDISFAEREAICALIRFHQHPFWLIERQDARYQALRIAQSAQCDHLALLAEADGRGRLCNDQEALLLRVACFREFCEEQNCLSSPYGFPSDHSRFLYFRSEGQRDPDYHAYEEKDIPEFVMLSGLPGVGKDTYIRQNLSHLPVVSLDAIRAELKIDWNDNQEPVLDVAREQTRIHLRQGTSVVWNATNLSRDLRGKRVRFADDYGARVRIVYVEASAAIQRRQNRSRSERVPESAMERMYRQWQVPDLTETHEIEWAIREGENQK
jgi:putative nucleotidyltransferase with HDIG domain